MVCFSDQCAIDVLSEEPEFIPKAQPLLSGEMDTLNDVKFPKFQQVSQSEVEYLFISCLESETL